MLKWLTRASAVGFWAGLAALWRFKRSLDRTLDGIKAELEADQIERDPGAPEETDGWDPGRWGWIVDADEGEDDGYVKGQPMYVPDELAERAIEILDAETDEEREWMKGEQWRWVVDAMAIRHLLTLGREEPNTEIALMQWIAHQDLPSNSED